MTEFLLILTFICAFAGIHFTASGIDLFDKYVEKGMTYGVMAFCMMIVFSILAGLQGVAL